MKKTSAFKKVLANPLGLIVVIYFGFTLLVALFGGMLYHMDPNYPDVMAVLQAPSDQHLLGTDSAGRDVLARLIYGTRTTLLAAFLVSVTAMLVGVPTGLLAGYYGGRFDAIASWFANMFMSLPAMIVLLSARAAIGPSLFMSMLIFGLLIAPGFFRLTRTAVMSVRNELYVDAARVSGLSDARIIGRHILTVVRAPLIIQTAMVSGVAISLQSGLEFLGLGDPSMVSWGLMLNDGFRNIYTNPVLLLWPALAISLTMASLVLFGNAFRDALEDLKRSEASAAQVESATSITKNKVKIEGSHLLSVENVEIAYPVDGGLKHVVKGVSFYVDKGETLGIVGESGSGKTQTAFSILGLLPGNALITGGTIKFDNEVLVSPDTGKASMEVMTKLRGKRIAYIPQEPMSNLDPNFRIGYQLVRPMVKVLGISKEEATKKAMELLQIVGITNPERVFNSFPHEISGGMAQRVLIAGAVSCDPDLLIADEPTTALDVTIQAEVLDLLRGLQDRFHMGILLVTHNFGVVADLCNRVVVMQYGEVVESGDVRTILKNPKEAYTQELLGSMLVDKEPLSFLTSGKGK